MPNPPFDQKSPGYTPFLPVHIFNVSFGSTAVAFTASICYILAHYGWLMAVEVHTYLVDVQQLRTHEYTTEYLILDVG